MAVGQRASQCFRRLSNRRCGQAALRRRVRSLGDSADPEHSIEFLLALIDASIPDPDNISQVCERSNGTSGT